MKSKGIKKKLWSLGLTGCLLGTFLCSSNVIAQEPGQGEEIPVSMEISGDDWKVIATSPGVEIVSQSVQNPGQVLVAGENPLDTAQDWLIEQGFEEGRNLYKDKLLYISIGSAVVNAKPDDPTFIDSRYLAFQRAELEAKAKTAIFLGVDITTERGSSEREINPKERAELEKIVNASPTMRKKFTDSGIAQDIYGLFQKAKRLADAKLDQMLDETGVDAAAENTLIQKQQRKREANKNRSERLRNISETSMKAAASAFADVQAMQTYQTFEGSKRGGYQVVVITLWSQNLQRLVDTMSAGGAPYQLPKRQAKQEVSKQLPQDPQKLACLSGVRAYINQRGEHVLLAFGQSGVEVIGGREDKAYELAGKKARIRSMAAVRNFMGEKVAFHNVEELREVLALYADEVAGGEGESDYKSISQFSEMIKAEAKNRRLQVFMVYRHLN